MDTPRLTVAVTVDHDAISDSIRRGDPPVKLSHGELGPRVGAGRFPRAVLGDGRLAAFRAGARAPGPVRDVRRARDLDRGVPRRVRARAWRPRDGHRPPRVHRTGTSDGDARAVHRRVDHDCSTGSSSIGSIASSVGGWRRGTERRGSERRAFDQGARASDDGIEHGRRQPTGEGVLLRWVIGSGSNGRTHQSLDPRARERFNAVRSARTRWPSVAGWRSGARAAVGVGDRPSRTSGDRWRRILLGELPCDVRVERFGK